MSENNHTKKKLDFSRTNIQRKFIILFFAAITILIVRQINLSVIDSQEQKAIEDKAIKAQYLKTSWPAMFTMVSLTLKTTPNHAKVVQDSIAKFFDNYTNMLKSNSRLDSIIFNAEIGDTIKLEPLSYELFEYADQKFYETKGSINPGIGNLLRHWGLMWNMKTKIPHKDSIAKEVRLMKTRFYQPIDSLISIAIQQKNRHFAMGAFSKGNAIYKASLILEHFKINDYFLEVGGDIATKGKNPRDTFWVAGIINPDAKDKLLGKFNLNGNMNSLATSGGYENFFIDSLGQKHHHILSPTTGYSIDDKKSVSAISSNARDADFWATYLFVLPFDSACKVTESTEGLEAIIKNSQDSVFISSNAQKYFENVH